MTRQPEPQQAEAATAGWDAIQLHRADNVAVALRHLPAGCEAAVRSGSGELRLGVRAAIDMGHKVAIRGMPTGSVVLKYGEAIGRLTAAVEAGEHVHVHNLASCRAQARADR